jgi:hypothetical protein
MYSGGPISLATGAKQTVGIEIWPQVNRQERTGVKFALRRAEGNSVGGF